VPRRIRKAGRECVDTLVPSGEGRAGSETSTMEGEKMEMEGPRPCWREEWIRPRLSWKTYLSYGARGPMLLLCAASMPARTR